METITIKLNKWRLLLIIVISVIFIMNALTILFEAKNEVVKTTPVLVNLVGISTLLFFSVVLYVASKQLFNPELGLTFDDEGINDHSNGVAVGLVKWENIIDIKTHRFLFMKSMVIYTNNPEKYLREAKGLKLRVLAGNLTRTKSPIVISSKSLKISYSNLEETTRRFWNKNKKI